MEMFSLSLPCGTNDNFIIHQASHVTSGQLHFNLSGDTLLNKASENIAPLFFRGYTCRTTAEASP